MTGNCIIIIITLMKLHLQGASNLPGATGVYVGIQQMEYGQLAAGHIASMGAFTATGTPFSVAAGRLSFNYGFHGPAVSSLLIILEWGGILIPANSMACWIVQEFPSFCFSHPLLHTM